MNQLNTKTTTHFEKKPISKTLISFVTLISLFTSSIAFAALGQAQVDDLISDLGYRSATPIDRIYNYRVNGFNAVNGDSVIINAGPKKKYLVTFAVHCHDVEFSQKIGFTTTLSQLTKFDNIIVSNLGTGREVCPIQNIYKLES